MKVGIVAHDSSLRGGANLCLLETIEALLNVGMRVQMFVPDVGELSEKLQCMQIPVSFVPLEYWVGNAGPLQWRLRLLARGFPSFFAVARSIKNASPDIVITNTITSPSGAIGARIAGIPHIWHLHELFGSHGHDLVLNLGRFATFKVINALSKRIVVVSEAAIELYREHLPPHKLARIYQPVNVKIPDAIPQRHLGKQLRLIHVGRIYSGKRQEDAIRALGLLAQKGITPHLTLLGDEDADYGRFLRILAQELRVQDRVSFKTFSAPGSEISASDVALMCSVGDAFGRVTVEAMKLGKPVVGARSGGTTELIRHGRNGLLYDPGNSADLADQISKLDERRDLIDEMGRKGQLWSARSFNTANYSTELRNLISAVVKN